MKNHIDNKRLQAACTVAFVLFLLLCAIKEKMLVTQEYQGWILKNYQGDMVVLYLLLAAGICFCILWKGKIQDKKKSAVCAKISILFMPAVSFYLFEMTVGNFKTIMQNTKGIIVLNLCVWYLLYMLTFMLVNSVKYTILLLSAVTYFVAVANAFVVEFRQQPIMLMDLRTIGTALSVAGEYTYEVNGNMLVMGLLTVLCCLWGIKIEFKLPNWKSRIGYAAVVCICTGGIFGGMLAGDLLEKAGMTHLDFFRFNESYKACGYMVCTIKTIQYLEIEKAENYSAEQVEKLAEQVEKQSKSEENLPENIIVIMNESFADLSVLGELETSVPVLSNFYNTEGNIQNGKLYVSAFGGGTPNSEYEFLTGNSMAFLPTGTVPYQMYVKKGDSSIVQILKNNGYKTIAYHPYRKENYNRPKVYDIYGFDAYYAKGDFKTKKIRNYPSDTSDYKALIKMHKEKEAGEKLFIFNITMQNHSGYTEEFDNTVSLTEYEGEFPQAEQYLSLLKESDDAWKYLIDYFSQIDEKTVILLFGDHQPCLETEFYEAILNGKDELSNLMNEYTTSYFLWANYDLKMEETPCISTNYLGSYLLDTIGIELPVYNQYLLELRAQIPAINVYGYLDAMGTLHWLNEENTYGSSINAYRMFQYNNLFDKKHRLLNVYE